MKKPPRVILLVVAVLVCASVAYLVAGIAALRYLNLSYQQIKPGMSRAQVQVLLRHLSETRATDREVAGRYERKTRSEKVYRYHFPLCGDIHVVYDSRDRVLVAIDTFE